MEVADALRIPLAPALVREALGDLALVRASIDNCESLLRLAGGEYMLAMTVPLGALRSRYVIRAHVAEARRLPRHDEAEGEVDAQTLSFKARGEGVGSLRGQIAVALIPDGNGESTWIEYTVWATLTGPLASLPPRQIENALREVADDFFADFCEVVRAKHGHPATQAPDAAVTRRHLFLRPIAMSAAFARPASAAAQKSRAAAADAIGGVLRHRLHGHAPRHHPHSMPAWAWAAMLGCVAIFLFLAQHYGLR
jgi:carbon monoxide dehydrogenase subunit G